VIWVVRIVALVLGLALVLAAGGWMWLRGSLPSTGGKTTVSGVEKPLTIVRDRHAVPHIQAETPNDALFGLGYVHAQDRLWQMEFNRRVGAGRLAEILGEAALPTDRFMRTLGVYALVERTYDKLDAETRSGLEAYARGVNAFLDDRLGPLPPEFLILGVKPEIWKPADSLVWVKLMAWDLSGNMSAELQRARLATRLDAKQIEEFLPPYPGDGPVALPDLRALYQDLPLERMLAELPMGDAANGSNNWVVSGARSATGKPLLANDPHLGLTAPSVWYFAQISAPGLDAIGATFPGVPTVTLGRNKRIAWGFTNTGPDVQDLYVEKIDPTDPARYLAPDGPRAFETRRETIKIKGKPEETITVRSTRHGPVISDVNARAREAAREGHVIALAWTALAEDDMTAQAGARLMRAGNWREFVEAIRDFHVPQQNMVYADIDGNIGFYAAGRVPIRKPEHATKGLAPAPGWDAANDWQGYIPFEKLPQAYNPPSGQVMTANHKIVPDGYPYYLSREWTVPYRARRLEALLAEQRSHSVEGFKRMQNDAVSLFARDILPLLLAAPTANAEAAKLRALLVGWNGAMDRSRAEPLVFYAWIRELSGAIYADELGPLFPDFLETRTTFLQNALTIQQHWCDDVTTPATETCAERIALALERARDWLNRTYGGDPARWRWGDAHFALGEHRPLGRNAWLARLFDVTIPAQGDGFSVNQARHAIANAAKPFAMIHGPGLRAIYDLDDPDRSVFIHTTGQSGNPLSDRYRDFAKPWADGDYVPMSMRPADYRPGALGTLTLVPRTP
jgi:penicillin amidase